MATPFDPKPLPGEDAHTKALAEVASAIAQTKLLISYAKVTYEKIEADQAALGTIKPGDIAENERLNRLKRDLKNCRDALDSYMGALTGYQTGEKQQPGKQTMPLVPAIVDLYVQSIKDGKDFVLPVYTG